MKEFDAEDVHNLCDASAQSFPPRHPQVLHAKQRTGRTLNSDAPLGWGLSTAMIRQRHRRRHRRRGRYYLRLRWKAYSAARPRTTRPRHSHCGLTLGSPIERGLHPTSRSSSEGREAACTYAGGLCRAAAGWAQLELVERKAWASSFPRAPVGWYDYDIPAGVAKATYRRHPWHQKSSQEMRAAAPRRLAPVKHANNGSYSREIHGRSLPIAAASPYGDRSKSEQPIEREREREREPTNSPGGREENVGGQPIAQ
eukprot:190529-Chlamydomonas_euryale.AAC.3